MSVLMVVTPWTMLSTRVRHDMSWIVRGVGIEVLLVPRTSIRIMTSPVATCKVRLRWVIGELLIVVAVHDWSVMLAGAVARDV